MGRMVTLIYDYGPKTRFKEMFQSYMSLSGRNNRFFPEGGT